MDLAILGKLFGGISGGGGAAAGAFGGQNAVGAGQISAIGSFATDAVGQIYASKNARAAARANKEIIDRERDRHVDQMRRKTRYQQSQNLVSAAAGGGSGNSSMIYAMADNAWQREMDIQDTIRGYNDQVRGHEKKAREIHHQSRMNIAGSLLGLAGEVQTSTGRFSNPFEQIRPYTLRDPVIRDPFRSVTRPDVFDPLPGVEQEFYQRYDDPVRQQDQWFQEYQNGRKL